MLIILPSVLLSGFILLLFDAIPFVEFFYPAARLQRALRSSIKRMTFGANFSFYKFFGRANNKRIATCAVDTCFWIIFWMYIWFHKWSVEITLSEAEGLFIIIYIFKILTYFFIKSNSHCIAAMRCGVSVRFAPLTNFFINCNTRIKNNKKGEHRL